MQPQTSSVSASNLNTGEVIAETWPTVVVPEISEEGGYADSVQSASNMQPDLSACNPKPVETCHVGVVLSGVGLKLKTGWLDQFLADVERSESDDLREIATRCLEKVLLSDMNSCGGGVLPDDVHSMCSDELAGPFVLQVDGIFDNTECPYRYERYAFMTDGVQRVVGMDHSPDLSILPPSPTTLLTPRTPTPTLKIVVSNVRVRRGTLLLEPDTTKVLKGVEEARELVLGVLATNVGVQRGISLFTPVVVNLLKQQEVRIRNRMVQARKRKGLDLETPSTNMTYFAELSQEWARIQDTEPDRKVRNLEGTIKLSITKLKRFSFMKLSKSEPRRREYEVVCYAHDGVLNSEIVLHNDVVEKRIGHTAEYVRNAFLVSKSAALQATVEWNLTRCKVYLAGFRGVMLVEMNESSQYPVATKIL